MTLELAEQYEQQEEYEKAYSEYKKLLNAKPNSVELLEKTAHIACILNKEDDAEKYLTKILESDPTNTLAYEQLMDMFISSDKFKYYSYRGNLHVLQQQFSHAIGDFKKALDKAPDIDRANATRFVLAKLYDQCGKDNNAIDEYLRILDSHEAPKEAYMNLSEVYLRQNAPSSAAEILERAIADGIDSKDVKDTLAEIYLNNNQADAASKVSSDELVQLRCLIENEDFKSALDKMEQMKADYKKNPKYLALVAQYYYQSGDYDTALESVEEFAKFDKKSPLIYQMRALIYEEKQEHFKAHYNWAKYYEARENIEVALNEYINAHQVDQEDTSIILTIAEMLDSMKDRTRAVEFYEKLYRLEPENKKALERLGEFRESIGDYKMAVQYFEKLHELDKRNSSVIKGLAKSYEKLKNYSKSHEFYSMYLKSSAVSEKEAVEINRKLDKFSSKQKEYADSDLENGGLIGAIMKFFGK